MPKKNLQVMLTTVATIAATAELDHRRAVAKQASADAAEALAAACAAPTAAQLSTALRALDELEQQKCELTKAVVRVELELGAMNKLIDVVGEAATVAVALQYHQSPNN